MPSKGDIISAVIVVGAVVINGIILIVSLIGGGLHRG